MKTKNHSLLLRNQRGQFVVEGILIMMMSMALLFAGMRMLRDANVISNLIDSPWERVAGMIESGSWREPAAAAAKHPNQRSRTLSLRPD